MHDLNRKIEYMSLWRDKMFRCEWAMQQNAEQMRDKLYMSHITTYHEKKAIRTIYMNNLESRQEIIIPELFRMKIE